MKEDLQYVLQKKSRKVRMLGFITMLIMVAINLVGQNYINSISWFLQGFGWIIWVPIALNFLLMTVGLAIGPILLSLMPGMIDLNELYKLAVSKGSYQIAAKVGRVIQIAKEVCAKAGEDYSKLRFIVNVVDDDVKNKKQSKNAGSLGTSANGTVFLNLSVIAECNDSQVAAIIAHEVGHGVSADSSISMMLKSLTKFYTAFSFIAFIVIWIVSGFGTACGAWLFWVFVTPYIFSLNSKAQEELADSYAIALGYGPGLVSFFQQMIAEQKMDPIVSWITSIYAAHPSPFVRIRDAKKLMVGDQGSVNDGAELGLWSLFKIVALVVGGWYLSGMVWVIPTLLWNIPTIYFTAGIWFFVSDSFLTSFNMITKLNVGKSTKTSLVGVVIPLLLLGFMFAAGIHASMFLATMHGMSLIGKIILWMWLAKPVTMILEGKSGLMAIISTITTYSSIIASLLILASLFITLPF